MSAIRFRVWVWAGLLILAALNDVQAEPSSGSGKPLLFSESEQRVIQRNQLLKDLVAADPVVLRNILDLLPKKPNPTNHPISGTNPDLRGENGHLSEELLSLIAKGEALTMPKSRTPPKQMRSPEGSVEYIEMMRRAKAAKDSSAEMGSQQPPSPPIRLEERSNTR